MNTFFPRAMSRTYLVRTDDKEKSIVVLPTSSRASTYSEVKRDHHGRLILVKHHHSASGLGGTPGQGVSGGNKDPSAAAAGISKGEVRTNKKEYANNPAMKDSKDVKPAAAAGQNTSQANKKNGPAQKTNQQAQNNAKKEFSSDDDAQLETLKAEGKTWREIAQEMKRPQGKIKNRFKLIDDSSGTDKVNGNAGKAFGQGQPGATKPNGPTQNRQEYNGDQKGRRKDGARRNYKNAQPRWTPQFPANQPAQWPSMAAELDGSQPRIARSVRSTSSSGVKFTLREWQRLQEDDIFSVDELKILSQIILGYQNLTWLGVASIFAGRTGRRVHPDDIRDKFQSLWDMGE